MTKLSLRVREVTSSVIPEVGITVVIKCRVHCSIILSLIKYPQRLCSNKSDQNINCTTSCKVLKFKNEVEARNKSNFAKFLENQTFRRIYSTLLKKLRRKF